MANLITHSLLLGAALTASAVDAFSGRPAPVLAQPTQTVCLGDTRGDRRCNHDSTHRVCAKIGEPDTSFWQHTGQHSWCNTRGRYGGTYGNNMRCPLTAPTWCICKWATASWIRGEGCNANIDIDCAATDICATASGLFFSYADFNTDLHPARECAQRKCAATWQQCKTANPNFWKDSHHK